MLKSDAAKLLVHLQLFLNAGANFPTLTHQTYSVLLPLEQHREDLIPSLGVTSLASNTPVIKLAYNSFCRSGVKLWLVVFFSLPLFYCVVVHLLYKVAGNALKVIKINRIIIRQQILLIITIIIITMMTTIIITTILMIIIVTTIMMM